MRIFVIVPCLLIVCCLAYSQAPATAEFLNGHIDDLQPDLALPSSVYVKVQLANSIKVSKLKTGNVIEGKLSQDVYSGDRELFSAGSSIHLTVDKLGKRRRIPNDHWPWVVKAFTPRHETYPTFQSATVTAPDGREVPLHVSLIFINRENEVRARTKTRQANESSDAASAVSTKKPIGAVITLQAATPPPATSEDSSSDNKLAGPITLPAGTFAKLILLGGVSASKSRPGDSFQARLVEPVRMNSSVVLPEGTLLAGKVVSRTPPRMLSRAGSLMLTFTDLTLPGGTDIPMAASVTGAELDQRSHTKIDPEGKMHGDRPGKAWMAINIGVTAGIAKEADDTLQLIIESVVSTATDASTAGVGRIAAACASGIFILSRHGRDVVLPKFTEMNIILDRPLSLPGVQTATARGGSNR
jgi:hypothetical protein